MHMPNLLIRSNLISSAGVWVLSTISTNTAYCVCGYINICSVPGFNCVGHICLPHYFNYTYGNSLIWQRKPVFLPHMCFWESCHYPGRGGSGHPVFSPRGTCAGTDSASLSSSSACFILEIFERPRTSLKKEKLPSPWKCVAWTPD